MRFLRGRATPSQNRRKRWGRRGRARRCARFGMTRVNESWERRDLLPGNSGKQWGRYALYSLGASFVGMVGALVCAFAIVSKTQRWEPVTVGFLALFLLGLLFGWILSLISDRKSKAEIRAGYTTSAQGNNQVVCLHSPTGVVMRDADFPNLT